MIYFRIPRGAHWLLNLYQPLQSNERHNNESLNRAEAGQLYLNIQQEKECDSLKISAEVHNSNCQLDSSGLQSGMIAEVNNNNRMPENSSLHFGMLVKVEDNKSGHEKVQVFNSRGLCCHCTFVASS